MLKKILAFSLAITMLLATACSNDNHSDSSQTESSSSEQATDSSSEESSSETETTTTVSSETTDDPESSVSESQTTTETKASEDSSASETTTKATADNTTKLTSKNTSQSTTKSTTKSTTATTKATTKTTTKQTTKSTTITTKTGGITLVGTEVNYYNLFTGKGTQADINAIINELRNWVIKEYNGRKGTITYKSNYSSGTPTDSFTVNYPINLKVNTSFNIDNNALLNIGSTIIYYPPYLQKYVGEEELRKIAKEYREHGLQMMSTGIHADVNTNNRWQKRNEVLEFNVGIVPWEENGGTTYALWFLTPC